MQTHLRPHTVNFYLLIYNDIYVQNIDVKQKCGCISFVCYKEKNNNNNSNNRKCRQKILKFYALSDFFFFVFN